MWNEYYRDQDLQDEVEWTNENVLYSAWEKDYFTTARPWQQKGTAPALPIAGVVFPKTVTDGIGLWSNQVGYKTVELDDQAATTHDPVVVDLSSGTTFDVSDIRMAFQIQKWLERNARAGTRYTEFLRAHFGVSPRDDHDCGSWCKGHEPCVGYA